MLAQFFFETRYIYIYIYIYMLYIKYGNGMVPVHMFCA